MGKPMPTVQIACYLHRADAHTSLRKLTSALSKNYVEKKTLGH